MKYYRHNLTLFIVIFGITTMTLLYNIFTPPTAQAMPVYMSRSTLEIENLESYVLSLGNSNRVYVLIGQNDDANTVYLTETVLHNLAQSANVDEFTNLDYVNVSVMNDQTRLLLNNTYHLTTLPAFVSLQNDNGRMTVTSILEWDDQSPIAPSDVQEWMQINNIWPGSSTRSR